MKLHQSQIDLLGLCCGEDWFTAPKPAIYRRCLRLHERKLLARHDTDSHKFTITVRGLNVLEENDDGKGL